MSRPNAFFDAQGHFRSQRGLAVQKIGEPPARPAFKIPAASTR